MVDLLDGLATLVLLAGAGLVIMEAFVPSGHFIVLGIALLAAGLVGVLAPLEGIALPLLMAATALITGAGAFYGYREFDFYGGKGIAQTTDSDSLRGSTGRVTERVTETDGEVKLDEGGFNPIYKARAFRGTIEEGDRVIVVDPGGGNVLEVESMAAIDEIDRELAADAATTQRERETE
ncbi:NfeD family protein [Halococcoides cellulosivorans]|uniref:Protease n=1 Tax=Halococcoides cellulosivorans TaxID=1679096 RepID=A0A2R4WZX4_9EURY|nr:NfeD family protein [Halococcoides cellulosivorans]AWB27077.1 protease [Halococcoides cellulosivorans]